MLSKHDSIQRDQLEMITLDHLRYHQDVNPIYAKRKETIERVFADAKEKHDMRWITLRGLKKLSMQAMLTFAAINLKKKAKFRGNFKRGSEFSAPL
ncbi:hypothetical protein BFRIG_02129 [Peribacillus frigoritolerans]